MGLELQVALKKYQEASDIAADWLIRSWELKDEDKTIALAYYSKARKECARSAEKLTGLTRKWRIQE